MVEAALGHQVEVAEVLAARAASHREPSCVEAEEAHQDMAPSSREQHLEEVEEGEEAAMDP